MEVFGACGENRNFRTKIIEVIRDFAGSKFTTPAECAKKLVDPSPDRNGRVNSRKIFTHQPTLEQRQSETLEFTVE